jgi:hypothetical protein
MRKLLDEAFLSHANRSSIKLLTLDNVARHKCCPVGNYSDR